MIGIPAMAAFSAHPPNDTNGINNGTLNTKTGILPAVS
jgi:hypothetical protein